MGVSSLPKTVTRQRHNCNLNPGLSAPESSMLTTRLPLAILGKLRELSHAIPPDYQLHVSGVNTGMSLCRVAGNTARFHMACEIMQRQGMLLTPIPSYITYLL